MANFGTNTNLNNEIQNDIALWARGATRANNDVSSDSLERINITNNNVTVSATDIGVACDVVVLDHPSKTYRQTRGKLSMTNASNIFHLTGGNLDLSGCLVTIRGGVRLGGSSGSAEGSGVRGRLINCRFSRAGNTNSINMNLGSEDEGNPIVEVGNVWGEGFVHQRIPTKIFVGIIFSSSTVSQAGNVFNFRFVTPKITANRSGYSIFYNCDFLGWLDSQGTATTQSFNVNPTVNNLNVRAFVVNPQNAPREYVDRFSQQ